YLDRRRQHGELSVQLHRRRTELSRQAQRADSVWQACSVVALVRVLDRLALGIGRERGEGVLEAALAAGVPHLARVGLHLEDGELWVILALGKPHLPGLAPEALDLLAILAHVRSSAHGRV